MIIYDFPHTEIETRAEKSNGCFVITQASDKNESDDVIVISFQDAINMANKILDHVRSLYE